VFYLSFCFLTFAAEFSDRC